MTLLGMMFGGFSGMGGCCNNGFPMDAYASITRNAARQMMFSNIFGMGFGGMGMIPGVATAPYAQQTTTPHNGANSAPTITKEQVDGAKQDWETITKTCNKAYDYIYKRTNKTEEEVLKATADATKNLNDARLNKGNLEIEYNKALEALKTEQDKLNGETDPTKIEKINRVIQEQDLQGKVKEAERKLEEANKKIAEEERKYTEAKIEEDAFTLSKEENAKELEALQEKANTAYKKYADLLHAYNQQLAKEASENAARDERAHDKTKTGSWWGRSKLNPKNWTNLNFKGEKDNSANVAKCLRKLQNKGRADAIEYGIKKGLIKKDSNGVLHTTHSELKGLCGLHNGRDKIVDQY